MFIKDIVLDIVLDHARKKSKRFKTKFFPKLKNSLKTFKGETKPIYIPK